jgi:hypothetical protein
MQSRPDLHATLLENIDDVYVCDKTAKFHYCGELCDAMEDLNDDKMFVCPITGRSKSEVDIRDNFWSRNPKQVDRDVVNEIKNNSEYGARRNIETVDVETVINSAVRGATTGAQNTKRKVTGGLKNEYMVLAIERLGEFFSKSRLQEIDKKKKERYRNTMKEFTKYVTKMNQKGSMMCTIDMHLIALAVERKIGPPNLRINLTDDMRRGVILRYAHQSIALWYIVKEKTKKGRAEPTSIPWPEFVDAAMAIFKDGFVIPCSDNFYEMVLIEPDPLLAYMPTGDFGNTRPNGHSSNVTKYSKKGNKTKIITFVKKALIDAVILEKVHPSSLRPDLVNYESIPDDAFARIRTQPVRDNKKQRR